MLPAEIEAQLQEIMASDLSEQEIRARYPLAIAWIRDQVDLVSLIQDSGINLQPVSADAPNVLVGRGCPSCGGPVAVRR